MIASLYKIDKALAYDMGIVDLVNGAKRIVQRQQASYQGHVGSEEEFDTQITLHRDGSVEVQIVWEM